MCHAFMSRWARFFLQRLQKGGRGGQAMRAKVSVAQGRGAACVRFQFKNLGLNCDFQESNVQHPHVTLSEPSKRGASLSSENRGEGTGGEGA